MHMDYSRMRPDWPIQRPAPVLSPRAVADDRKDDAAHHCVFILALGSARRRAKSRPYLKADSVLPEVAYTHVVPTISQLAAARDMRSASRAKKKRADRGDRR